MGSTDSKLYHGALSTMFSQQDRPASFSDIVRRRSVETPDKTAFIYIDSNGLETDSLTYAELDRRVESIASELILQNLSGCNVLLLFPPGLEFVSALFACFRAGVTAVPVPFTAGRRTEDRVVAICRDAAPSAILSVSSFAAAEGFRALFAANHLSVAWLFSDHVATASTALVPDIGRSDDIAFLQYTSGSTGAPKGVMLSHGNLIANSAMIAAAFGHDESLRGVGWLPLFHDMGLIGHVLQPVFVGGLSVIMSPFTFLQRPRRWFEAISAWQATTSGGPSHGYALCLRSIREALPANIDLSSWKVAYCGAERVRPDVLAAFSERFRPHGFDHRSLLACYGLAEASLLVTATPAGRGLQFPDVGSGGGLTPILAQAVSCGPQWGNSSVEVVDPDTGSRCADGVVGEIRVKGPHVAKGYWARPDESLASFAIAEKPELSCLKTGDLGFLWNGELHIVGRLKDIIIIFGAKHAAEDLELTVANCDPIFAKYPCAAFGFDSDGQEQAVIVQEASPVSVGAAALSESAARASAAVTFEHGVKLREILLVKPGSLPRTSSGKIQRLQSKLMYADGQFVGLPEISAQQLGRATTSNSEQAR